MRVYSAMANYYLSCEFHKVNHSVYTKITQIACLLAHLLKFSLLCLRGLPRSNPLCSPSLCRRNLEDRISNHLPTFPLWSVRMHNFLLLTQLNSVAPFSWLSSCIASGHAVPRSCSGVAGRAGVFLAGLHALPGKEREASWETTLPPFILIYSAHYGFEWYFRSGRMSCDSPLFPVHAFKLAVFYLVLGSCPPLIALQGVKQESNYSL